MRRQTGDRVRMIGEIDRPKRPEIGSPEHHFNHHAVHLATCWIHELTDFGIEEHFNKIDAAIKNGKRLTPKQLDKISRDMLELLKKNSNLFTSEDYASIYHHISKGIKDGN